MVIFPIEIVGFPIENGGIVDLHLVLPSDLVCGVGISGRYFFPWNEGNWFSMAIFPHGRCTEFILTVTNSYVLRRYHQISGMSNKASIKDIQACANKIHRNNMES